MTKQEQIDRYRAKQLQKAQLQKARELYIYFRNVNRETTDELQKRFDLFPVLDEIEI